MRRCTNCQKRRRARKCKICRLYMCEECLQDGLCNMCCHADVVRNLIGFDKRKMKHYSRALRRWHTYGKDEG